MKIRLVCVGKPVSAPLKTLAEDYRKRLERLADVEVVELKDADAPDAAARLVREAVRIREAAGPAADCVLLDERGEEMDSLEFSRFLEKLEGASTKRITFILGSSHGLDPSLKSEVRRKLALSRMTLTHEWARALFLEQLYRAQCIRRKIPYHH